MPELQTKVIVNPEAGSRSVSREWPHIEMQLQKAGLSFDHEFTRRGGHALEIASQAISDGYNYLIAVGGDGTINEVANGILHSPNSADIILGIVSAGTAHAFSFSMGTAENNEDITSYSLIGKRKILIDVGVVQCWNQGRAVERFFLNEASIGLAAEIVDAWKSLPNNFGKRMNYALRNVAGYKALSTHRNKKVKIRIGTEFESVPICTLMVSNGRYCADRMLIAPDAILDDGLFNVIVVGNVSKYEVVKIRPALYNGSHLKHPKIREIKTSLVKIESVEHLVVEADGDILGECPATFRVMPSALKVVVI